MTPSARDAFTDRLVRRRGGLSILALWCTFSGYSLARVPIPAVNEPHYLTKARHYWQPEWCAGDLFLESADAHLVFYQTVGVLTDWLSLPVAALVARLLAFACLAAGWHRLLSRWLPQAAGPVLASWVFLLLQTAGNFAGEWLVSGVEGKVFAWALAMWGAACLLDRRQMRAALLLGLAVSFHPVVGCWCLLLLGGVAAGPPLWARWRRRLKNADAGLNGANGSSRVGLPSNLGAPLGRVVMAMGVFAAASLWGIVPAVRMLLAAEPAVALRADLIQVGIRLGHHLDPLSFPLPAYRYYALLLVVWGLLRSRAASSSEIRWFERFVIASVLLSLIGLLLAAGPRPLTHMPGYAWRIKFLKLYPFRVADLVVPVAIAVAALRAAQAWCARSRSPVRARGVVFASCAAALLVSSLLPGEDRNPARMSAFVDGEWRDACEWLRSETPRESLLYATNEDWAVKWYAERPEYVNYKDCPQDAAGIVEWHERLLLVRGWARDSFLDGRCTADELRALHARTGITHLLVSRFGPVDAEAVYENRVFRILPLGASNPDATRNAADAGPTNP